MFGEAFGLRSQLAAWIIIYLSAYISAKRLTIIVAFSGCLLTVTSLYGRFEPSDDDMMRTLVMLVYKSVKNWGFVPIKERIAEVV